MLSTLYGAAARARRRWYEARPARRRRLERPVVSVGALAVGGSGKTPVAGVVAGLLRDAGERPAVLSRGYARRRAVAGPVVVSDGREVTADLDTAGDEPLMLAEAWPGVSVVVCGDRYAAGRLAESTLGATVHVLDDGRQHLGLHRDVDVLLLSGDDLLDRPLPGGRLREPLETATGVDALVVEQADEVERRRVADAVGVPVAFGLTRALGPPRDVERGEPVTLSPRTPVLAVAAIASPQRFVDALRGAGYDVVDVMRFRDHHRYTRADAGAVARRAEACGATQVLTTAKDMVRLRPLAPWAIPMAWVPLEVTVEPSDAFGPWLRARLAAVRGGA